MTRVLVVEDHPLYRQAVVRLVEGITGWEVVADVPDAESALPRAAEVDLVVLDLGLPGTDGLTAIRLLKRANELIGKNIRARKLYGDVEQRIKANKGVKRY